MLTTVCCLVVGLGLGLDLLSGWLVVMHRYLYYFRLSLSDCRWQLVKSCLAATGIAGPTVQGQRQEQGLDPQGKGQGPRIWVQEPKSKTCDSTGIDHATNTNNFAGKVWLGFCASIPTRPGGFSTMCSGAVHVTDIAEVQPIGRRPATTNGHGVPPRNDACSAIMIPDLDMYWIRGPTGPRGTCHVGRLVRRPGGPLCQMLR